eukprot:COSAG06_NODE_8194_length_2243_cov_4.729011_3_plen_75_part_00
MRHYKKTQIVTWRTQGDGDDAAELDAVERAAVTPGQSHGRSSSRGYTKIQKKTAEDGGSEDDTAPLVAAGASSI